MNTFDNILVTDIKPPVTVHIKEGKNHQTPSRTWWGLSLCVSGQVTYTMNGKKYVANKGTATLLPQGGAYSLCGDRDGIFPLINFSCEGLELDSIRVFRPKNPDACFTHYNRIKALSLFQENRLKLFSIFYELLDSMTKTESIKHPLLSSAVAYIQEHLADPTLCNTVLAKREGISEVYLRKLFLTHYGTTPRQYILDIRIQKAKQLLTDTAYTVSTVAECCGFSSPYHFCRAFKDRTGLTPTQFAEQNRIYKI